MEQKKNYLTYYLYNEKGELMGTLLTTEKIEKVVLNSEKEKNLKRNYSESPKAHFLNYKNEDSSNSSQRVEDWFFGYRK